MVWLGVVGIPLSLWGVPYLIFTSHLGCHLFLSISALPARSASSPASLLSLISITHLLGEFSPLIALHSILQCSPRPGIYLLPVCSSYLISCVGAYPVSSVVGFSPGRCQQCIGRPPLPSLCFPRRCFLLSLFCSLQASVSLRQASVCTRASALQVFWLAFLSPLRSHSHSFSPFLCSFSSPSYFFLLVPGVFLRSVLLACRFSVFFHTSCGVDSAWESLLWWWYEFKAPPKAPKCPIPKCQILWFTPACQWIWDVSYVQHWDSGLPFSGPKPQHKRSNLQKVQINREKSQKSLQRTQESCNATKAVTETQTL